MAAFNDNSAYIKLGGKVLSGIWQSAKISPKNSKENVTAGNVTHAQKVNGLNEYSYELKIICEDGSALATYLRKLSPDSDAQELDLGIRGNKSGDPRMLQNVLVEEAPIEVTSEKKPAIFEVKLVGSEAPILDMYHGATY